MDYIPCDRCDFGQGDRIAGRYHVDKKLGEGAFGQVYRVKDSNGGVYALKLLKLWEVLSSVRASLLLRFDREYETGRIRSNYLTHSLEKGVVGGNPYILMEYCPGGDLLSRMEQGEVDIPKTATEILYGLRDLHRNGKVHRDLKPKNVLLRSDGVAVLTDFGISGDQNKRLTERGITGIPKERFGTFAYMPPEQVNPPRGAATVLPTTDIFSLGVMLFQMLTGELPFGPLRTEADLPTYVERGKRGRWDRTLLMARKEDSSWEQVIAGCLQPDFKQRLQSVDDVLQMLPSQNDVSRRVSYRHQPSGDLHFQLEVVNGVQLKVMQGEDYGRTYRLNDLIRSSRSAIVTLGREDTDIRNTIMIRETDSCYISRCHCTLEMDQSNGHWFVRDGQWRDRRWKQSLNGTYVNSSEVTSAGYYLHPGDIITVGDVKLRVEGY